MRGTPGAILTVARQEIGYKESPSGSNKTKYGQWYGLNGEPWCAMWVSWVFYHAGLPLPASTSKGFAYTPAGAAWFKKQGRWRSNTSSDVEPGDVVFFYWPNMGRIAHVGIVEKVNADGTVTTLEGNTDAAGGRTGGCVMRRVRSRSTIGSQGGFGKPAWAEEDDMFSDADRALLRETMENAEKAKNLAQQALDAAKATRDLVSDSKVRIVLDRMWGGIKKIGSATGAGEM